MTKNQLDDAVYDFIAAFAFDPPAAPACAIYKGYQNLVSLPAEPDYIVFTDVGDDGLERGMEGFHSDPGARGDGVQVVANLRRYVYQIASVGKSARTRLARLAAVFNAAKGAEFFRRKTFDKYGGAGPLRAGKVTDQTRPDGTSNYAVAYAAEFALAARVAVGVPQDWADEIRPTLSGCS